MAVLTPAVVVECVAVVTVLAVCAGRPVRVVQTLQAAAGPRVARPGVRRVHVAAALARPTLPARNLRVAVVTGSAAVAPGTWMHAAGQRMAEARTDYSLGKVCTCTGAQSQWGDYNLRQNPCENCRKPL